MCSAGSAPSPTAAEAEADAKGELVRTMASTLEGLVAQIAKLSSRIENAVAQLPEGRIVMSFPRAGKICAAQITAELGDVRTRFQSEDHLAAEAGVAPVHTRAVDPAASAGRGPATNACAPP
ncbi:transposase [Mesorhizobium sp. M0520]|uniref:transposase n=1 Tax=Mesorhizobium sp. M0520 TaxID=2956957 RepID=UPI00333B695D